MVTLKKDIEKCSINASAMDNFEAMKTELQKGNRLRETLGRKEETSKELEVAIHKLEDELIGLKDVSDNTMKDQDTK